MIKIQHPDATSVPWTLITRSSHVCSPSACKGNIITSLQAMTKRSNELCSWCNTCLVLCLVLFPEALLREHGQKSVAVITRLHAKDFPPILSHQSVRIESRREQNKLEQNVPQHCCLFSSSSLLLLFPKPYFVLLFPNPSLGPSALPLYILYTLLLVGIRHAHPFPKVSDILMWLQNRIIKTSVFLPRVCYPSQVSLAYVMTDILFLIFGCELFLSVYSRNLTLLCLS